MDKIVVVDDERINLMIIKRILGDAYDVMVFQSGEEALEELKNETPTLILLDIHMQGMDGYDTLRAIREVDRLKQVPVIFLTADDDVEAEVNGFQLGADDFIRKPFVSEVVKKRVNRSIESFRLHCNLQDEVKRQTRKAEKNRRQLEIISREIIQALATAIDAKDIYTKGHSTRVAEYSAILAGKLGWNEEQIEMLRYKAILHDVGKIGIPDRVLNKAGKLTEEEFEIIKSHAPIGSDILKSVSSLSNMYMVARNHHERYDGKGYPDHLSGKDIPEEARLVGIADAYDAMSSDRVYRKALSNEIIREELIKGKGTQFDPDMLDDFLELFDEGKLDLSTYNSDVKEIEENVTEAILGIVDEYKSRGAMRLNADEIGKVYSYVENVHMRYGLDYNTVLISLTWDEEVDDEDIRQAMQAMEYSIVQSLRKVDITSKVSASQFLLVLTEAHQENIHMIVERIFAGFFKNCLNVKIKPSYEMK